MVDNGYMVTESKTHEIAAFRELLPPIAETRWKQASALGITRATLQNYLSGRYPVPTHIMMLAERLALVRPNRVDDFRELLPRIGDSRREQAEALGIARPTLMHYLNGERHLPESVARLASILAAPEGE